MPPVDPETAPPPTYRVGRHRAPETEGVWQRGIRTGVRADGRYGRQTEEDDEKERHPPRDPLSGKARKHHCLWCEWVDRHVAH